MMKIFLHICCAPCAIFTVDALREKGFEPVGFFFNPNIHPYLEYRKRLMAVRQLAKKRQFQLVESDEYDFAAMLKAVLDFADKDDRCDLCHKIRLEKTAIEAKKANIDAFTTTLLYSRYQRHDSIRAIAEAIAEKYEVPFIYSDFRIGWSKGITLSRKMGLYRQQYCGCIFSEYERYRNTADAILDNFEKYP